MITSRERMEGILLVFAILATCTLVPTLVSATDLPKACRQDLVANSTSLPFPYQARRNGPYCDGSVAYLNRGELTLVSFMIGDIAFPSMGAILTINVPTFESGQEVYINGQVRYPGMDYRMDGIVPGNGLKLDLDAAILPKQIGAKDLAFVAWREEPQGTLYFPLFTAGAPGNTDAVMLIRNSLQTIEAVQQVCEAGGQNCQPEVTVAQQLPANSLLEIKLVRTSSNQLLEVTVTVLGPGNSKRSEIYNVFLPGRL